MDIHLDLFRYPHGPGDILILRVGLNLTFPSF